MRKPRTIKPPPVVLAFAIEDGVEFAVYDGGVTRATFHRFTVDDHAENYFSIVYRLMTEAISTFLHSLEKDDIIKTISSIEAIVVSCPGVIHENRVLVQLPLWTWPSTPVVPSVTWDLDNKRKDGFDFAIEISNIFAAIMSESLSISMKEELYSKVFAVNDATASAVFEYSKRHAENLSEINQKSDDLVYIKMHYGINAGVIEQRTDGMFSVRITHPEAGHFYPIKHQYDIDYNFSGECKFHSSCLEGMISTHSIYKRAIKRSIGPFGFWHDKLKALENSGLQGNDLENKFILHLLSSDLDAINIVAFYISQLVHRLATGSLAPSLIVLGGRMANPLVVQAVQRNVLLLCNGYPRQSFLQNPGIRNFIVSSSADYLEQNEVDLRGALNLALDRAGVLPADGKASSKFQEIRPREFGNIFQFPAPNRKP